MYHVVMVIVQEGAGAFLRDVFYRAIHRSSIFSKSIQKSNHGMSNLVEGVTLCVRHYNESAADDKASRPRSQSSPNSVVLTGERRYPTDRPDCGEMSEIPDLRHDTNRSMQRD